jgi:hypothetical protein
LKFEIDVAWTFAKAALFSRKALANGEAIMPATATRLNAMPPPGLFTLVVRDAYFAAQPNWVVETCHRDERDFRGQGANRERQ